MAEKHTPPKPRRDDAGKHFPGALAFGHGYAAGAAHMTNLPSEPPASQADPPRYWRVCGQGAATAQFLIMVAVLAASLWLPIGFARARTVEATLLFASAALTLIVSLSRQLPLQNVLLAALVIGLTGGAAEVLSRWTGFPLGAWRPARDSGPMLFGLLPLFTPLLWVTALLSSRGVARLILRPRRPSPGCGFWLLGLTPSLACLLDASLEPFATEVKQWWHYDPAAGPRLWQAIPLQTLLGWLLTSAIALCLAAPALVNKSPARFPPDFGPLVVWTAFHLLFACGALRQHHWSLAALTLSATLAVASLAVRNGRIELPDCEAPPPPG